MEWRQSILLLSLVIVCTIDNISGRNIYNYRTNNGFFQSGVPAQVEFISQQYNSNQNQEQQIKFPNEEQEEDEEISDALNIIEPQASLTSDNDNDNLNLQQESTTGEEDEEIDTKFLSNINVNDLTPEQKVVYDELIELAKEEDEASSSQVQGRTFGLFKLKFHYLWNKFKSLFGPRYLEFYAEPQQHQAPQYGEPHYFNGDFKKRNEPVGELINSQQPYHRVEEDPFLQIPIVGDITRFITRTVPKYFNFFQPSQQVSRNYYDSRSNRVLDSNNNDYKVYELRNNEYNSNSNSNNAYNFN